MTARSPPRRTSPTKTSSSPRRKTAAGWRSTWARQSRSSRSTRIRGTPARAGRRSTSYTPPTARRPGSMREPKKGTDPAKCGWKLLAPSIPAPSSGEGGGQYGVSVSDSAGAIGKYRYLLFDISATEKDDPFGNTFYSEIDVIDAAGPKPRKPRRARVARLISKSPDCGPVPDHHRLYRRAGTQGLGGEEAPAHGRTRGIRRSSRPCRARTSSPRHRCRSPLPTTIAA